MDPLFEKNLIGTKEAGEISGYSPDYLSRLARSKKIIGRRIGHSWFIDRASLEAFLATQSDRKMQYARALSSMREQEYRAHRSPVRKISKVLSMSIRVPQMSGFGSELVALTVAISVIGGGAFLAQAAFTPEFGSRIVGIAFEAAEGFRHAFGEVPARIAAKIVNVREYAQMEHDRVVRTIARGSEAVAPIALQSPDLSFMQMRIEAREESSSVATATIFETREANVFVLPDVRAFLASVRELIVHPSRIAVGLGRAYVALGERGYELTLASLEAYRALLIDAGAGAFAFGVTARDTISQYPAFVHGVNLSVAQAVAFGSRGVLSLHESLIYGAVEVAPKTAETVVVFAGNLGNTLAFGAAAAPHVALATYLEIVEIPSIAAPAIAKAVFDVEYAAAKKFVIAADRVAHGYLSLVETSGRVMYDGSSAALAFAQDASPVLARLPQMLQNAYLGALGQGALAVESFGSTLGRVPGARSVAAAVAAMIPDLTVPEQIALSTYETIHGFVSSASRTISGLFGSKPAIVVNTGTASTTPAQSGTTATTSKPIAVETNPVYTTVIQGASPEYVDQSIASARSGILTQMSELYGSLARGLATTNTTINYVSRIEDLTGLIVRNGDFRGGKLENASNVTATNATFTNLTATNATLGASTFSGNVGIGTTSPYAALSVVGETVASYFTATSTTATSTFYGGLLAARVPITPHTFGSWLPGASNSGYSTASLVIDPASAAADTNLFGIAVAGSVKFLVDAEGDVFANSLTTTGTVTLSTTTASTFTVENNTTLGDAITDTTTINGTLIVTGTTTTSTVQGKFGVGTTTPWGRLSVAGLSGGTDPLLTISSSTSGFATSTVFHITSNGFLGVGTTSPLGQFSINATGSDPSFVIGSSTGTNFLVDASGNVGIGTTTPGAKLAVAGSGLFNSILTALGKITAPFFTSTSTSENSTFAGNVGVGTSTPYSRLSVWGAGSGSARLFELTNSASTTLASVLEDGTSYFRGNVGIGSTTPWGLLSVNPDGVSGPAFVVGSSTATNFIVTNAGRVGIGTSAPSYELDVNGQGRFTATTTASYFAASTLGAAGAPAFAFASDLDTGIWSSGANTLNISTAGAERLTVTSSGFLGIGTSTPYSKLSVWGSGSGTSRLFELTNSASTTLTSVLEDGTTYLRGNVGIGTTSPYRTLSVANTAAVAQAVIAYDTSRYAELQVDSVGDFILNPQGDDASLLDDNFWVCSGGSCPSGTPSGTGNLIVETRLGIGSSTPWASLAIGANGAITTTEKSLTDSSTIAIDWRDGNQQKVTLAGNRTITMTGYLAGQILRLVVCQDSTGSRTVTWPTILWSEGTAPTLTTTANKCDVTSFVASYATSSTAVQILGSSVLNF